MRTACFTIFVCLHFVMLARDRHEKMFEGRKIIYHTQQGKLHGTYTSYYKNGRKKAEGNFDNHYRTGSWKVWDSTGLLVVHRVYSNPFTFEQVVPSFQNDALISLLHVPKYRLDYNGDGYINYFKLQERMVLWQKRVWRNIYPENNEFLFEPRVLRTLNRLVADSTITAYDPKNDKFRYPFKPTLDTTARLVTYRIKEDWFYDNERCVMECRVIGICPVVRSAQGDTLALYWLYYPALRKHLAGIRPKEKYSSVKIKSLDDVFFFRCFASVIYQEARMDKQAIAGYTKTAEEAREEAIRIEIEMIETEQDIWQGFFPLFRD